MIKSNNEINVFSKYCNLYEINLNIKSLINTFVHFRFFNFV